MAAKQRLQIGIGKTQEKSWWIDTGVSNRTVLPQRGVLRLFARQQLVSRWNICGGERGPPPPTTGGAHRQAHISKKDHQHHQHSHTHTHLLPLRQHFHSTLPNLCTHLPPDESHSPSTHSIVVCWVLMPCRCRGGGGGGIPFRCRCDIYVLRSTLLLSLSQDSNVIDRCSGRFKKHRGGDRCGLHTLF